MKVIVMYYAVGLQIFFLGTIQLQLHRTTPQILRLPNLNNRWLCAPLYGCTAVTDLLMLFLGCKLQLEMICTGNEFPLLIGQTKLLLNPKTGIWLLVPSNILRVF